MDKIVIKFESTPKRCEICHKSDFFDENTNNCFRCKEFIEINRKLNSISNSIEIGAKYEDIFSNNKHINEILNRKVSRIDQNTLKEIKLISFVLIFVVIICTIYYLLPLLIYSIFIKC